MGIAGEAGEKAGKMFGDMMETLASGKTINHSNQTINKIGNSFLGGGEMAAKMYTGQSKGIKQAARDTFMDGDKVQWGKVAGSYIGASAAARVVTGGGAYKDRNGNTNVMGVPFV